MNQEDVKIGVNFCNSLIIKMILVIRMHYLTFVHHHFLLESVIFQKFYKMFIVRLFQEI